MPDDLRKKKFTASIVARLIVRKPPKNPETGKYDSTKDTYKDFQKTLDNCNSLRLSVCRDMIGNTICADLLDYLYRDWYHIGKQKTFDERILQYMEIKAPASPASVKTPGPSHKDRFVVSLGKRPRIRTDAISAILDLLELRYHLAESVLFHRTKISASAMLDRALYELWGGKTNGIEEFLLPLSDEELVSKGLEVAKEKDLEVPSHILANLEKRELFAILCVYSYDDLPEHVRAKVQSLYVEDPKKPTIAARNRTDGLRLLERDFNLPPGSLAMHCPSRKMNHKIALVRISVDDCVEEFCTYERKRDNPLSGGHLDAQIKRFQRLWKIHFFIRRDLLSKRKGSIDLLREAVEKLMVGYLRHEEKHDDAGYRIAANLSTLDTGGSHKKELVENINEKKLAAHRDQGDFKKYPTGAFSVGSFFKKNETELSK